MDDAALSNILQENLLTLLCFDDKHAVIIRGLVEADLFEGYYREIARSVYVYIDTQKKAPKDHLADLFDTIIEKNDRKAKQFRNILRQLNQTREGVNTKFVMERLSEFVRLQQLKGATMEVIEIFQSGRVDQEAMQKVESVLAQAMRKRLEVFDPGVHLGDKKRALNFLDIETDTDIFHTGIKELDSKRLGPLRRGLHLFIGLPKKGKSWWLVNLGKNAYLEGHKVLHISLEMSEERMVRRYYQALFAMAKRKAVSELEAYYQTRFNLDELGKLISFERKRLKPKLYLSDPEIREKLGDRLDRFGLRLNRIMIKDFPTGQLTIPALEAYLDGLELQQGFIPDLVMVDYPLLMKFDHKYQRQMLGQIVKELRGIAVQRNMAMVIVSQSSKKGSGAMQVADKHVAEDWSQIGTADVILTYSQTEQERQLGLARIYVADARDEEDQFTVLIAQNYATGQFCRASVRMHKQYWSVLDEYTKSGEGENDESEEEESED